jgi:hypothetical protein
MLSLFGNQLAESRQSFVIPTDENLMVKNQKLAKHLEIIWPYNLVRQRHLKIVELFINLIEKAKFSDLPNKLQHKK